MEDKMFNWTKPEGKIFENECKPFVIEPTPVKVPLWG